LLGGGLRLGLLRLGVDGGGRLGRGGLLRVALRLLLRRLLGGLGGALLVGLAGAAGTALGRGLRGRGLGGLHPLGVRERPGERFEDGDVGRAEVLGIELDVDTHLGGSSLRGVLLEKLVELLDPLVHLLRAVDRYSGPSRYRTPPRKTPERRSDSEDDGAAAVADRPPQALDPDLGRAGLRDLPGAPRTDP